MSDTFVRYIQLGGSLAKATKNLNGYRFVNGVATLRTSDEDFAKVMRYFVKCYQAEEVKDPNGKREVHESRTERTVPPLESRVSTSRGASQGPPDNGSGTTDSETRPEKPKAKRGRPKRSETSVAKEDSSVDDSKDS